MAVHEELFSQLQLYSNSNDFLLRAKEKILFRPVFNLCYNDNMRKYLIQILVILIMLVIAWGLLLLEAGEKGKKDKSIEASIQRFPKSLEANIIPIRNWSIEEPDILAKSAIVVNFKNQNEQGSILYQKNINQILPIASLTKIMTAIIALENFNLEEIIKVSKDSVSTLGNNGELINGEELKVRDLLYIMLMESSNDAAMTLTNDNPRLSFKDFISLMNTKAKELGLGNTYFADPVGLSAENKSTVFELAYLIKYGLNFPLLWQILKTSETTIYSTDSKFVHNLINTNELLNKISNLLGGKTGYTEDAGGCMLTVSEIPTSLGDNNYLITVVLGSSQRETDTEDLIFWAKAAHIW